MLHLGGGETAIIVSIVICSILLVLSVVGKGKSDVFPGCPSFFFSACGGVKVTLSAAVVQYLKLF